MNRQIQGNQNEKPVLITHHPTTVRQLVWRIFSSFELEVDLGLELDLHISYINHFAVSLSGPLVMTVRAKLPLSGSSYGDPPNISVISFLRKIVVLLSLLVYFSFQSSVDAITSSTDYRATPNKGTDCDKDYCKSKKNSNGDYFGLCDVVDGTDYCTCCDSNNGEYCAQVSHSQTYLSFFAGPHSTLSCLRLRWFS